MEMTAPRADGQPPLCEVCGSGTWHVVHSGLVDRIEGGPGEFDLWECETCGVGRIWPVPADLSAYYPESYPAFRSGDTTPSRATWLRRTAWQMGFRDSRLARALSGRILRRTGPVPDVALYAPGPFFRLLDVGCGSGQFLADARSVGIDAVGLELSEYGTAATRARGVPCSCGTLEEDTFPPMSFDVVRFAHVLEHVPSPAASLRAAAKVLRPDGTLVVMVPDKACLGAHLFGRDWYPLQPPAHIWHFTDRSLRMLLEQVGFTVQQVSHCSWGGCLYHSMRFFWQSRGHDAMPAEVPPQAAPGFDGVMAYLDSIGAGDALYVIARAGAQ